MKVRKLFFREMGSYNQMFAHPFKSDYDGRVAVELDDITRGGRDISATLLSGIASKILRPSADAECRSRIANGWNTTRFMFIMEVEVMSTATKSTVEVITGYTDSVEGITHSGNISHDMTMYFNGTFTVHTLTALGSRGAETISRIKDAGQLIARRTEIDYSPNSSSVGTVTMRPEDLFVNKSAIPEVGAMANAVGFKDLRNSMTGALKFSSRSNVLAPNYLNKTMASWRDSADQDDLFVGNDDTDVSSRLANARGKVRERSLVVDTIYEELARDTGIMNRGYITFGELRDMNRDIEKVVDVNFNKPGSYIHRAGDTVGHDGRDTATIAATIVANSVPYYLMECMYSHARFHSTNQTRDGGFFTKVPLLHPFTQGSDIDENYNLLISKITTELMPTLLLNDQMDISVEVECAIYGETKVDISIDGGRFETFVFPTFCDSLTSPIVTDRKEVLDDLADDIIKMSDGLGSYTESFERKPAPEIYTGRPSNTRSLL